LELTNNELKFIEKDLFLNNPRLEFIDLRNNQINFIHAQVFDNLNYLKALLLSENSWKLIDATNVEQIKALKKDIETLYSSTLISKTEVSEMIHTSIDQLKNSLTSQIAGKVSDIKLNDKLKKLETKFDEIEERNDKKLSERDAKYSEAIKNLETKFGETISNFKTSENLMKDFQSELEKTNKTLSALQEKMEAATQNESTYENHSESFPSNEKDYALIAMTILVGLCLIFIIFVSCKVRNLQKVMIHANRSEISPTNEMQMQITQSTVALSDNLYQIDESDPNYEELPAFRRNDETYGQVWKTNVKQANSDVAGDLIYSDVYVPGASGRRDEPSTSEPMQDENHVVYATVVKPKKRF
jgi:DNA repair exonuclease SbcCD ATPase subunit